MACKHFQRNKDAAAQDRRELHPHAWPSKEQAADQRLAPNTSLPFTIVGHLPSHTPKFGIAFLPVHAYNGSHFHYAQSRAWTTTNACNSIGTRTGSALASANQE